MERTAGASSRTTWSDPSRLGDTSRESAPVDEPAGHLRGHSASAPADRSAQQWVRATSPDEAGQLCGDAFHPHLVKTLGPSRGFAYRQRVTRIGPITIGDFSYKTDVRLEFDETRKGYDIAIPVAGRLDLRSQGSELTASVDAAAVGRPTGEKTVVRWLAGTRILAVKIEQDAVENALERLIGQRPVAPLSPAAELPLTDSEARIWMRLLATASQLDEPGNPAWHTLVTEPLAETLIHGFLLLTDHRYREALHVPIPAGKPSVVRLAVEIIKSSPALPLTVSSLAAQCHVSVRTLQAGFQRDLGTSPMAYLREERLHRAHTDLTTADAGTTSVATIAHRWGFSHLGRFSAAHKARYGLTPAQALRSRSARGSGADESPTSGPGTATRR